MWLNEAYAALVRRGVTGNDLAIMNHICFRAGASAVSTQSIANIARELGMHRTTAQRCIKGLEDAGLIQRRKGGIRVYYDVLKNAHVSPDATHVMHHATHVMSDATLSPDATPEPEKDVTEATECSVTLHEVMHHATHVMHHATQTNTLNYSSGNDVVDNIQSISREEIRVPLHQATPLDVWILETFTEFGYSLPAPTASNIASRTLGSMSRDFAEEYITERLCELTGQSQSKVVKYVLQDGPTWLQRRLNPPPAREAKGRKRDKERIVDEGVRTYQPPVPDDFWANQPTNQEE